MRLALLLTLAVTLAVGQDKPKEIARLTAKVDSLSTVQQQLELSWSRIAGRKDELLEQIAALKADSADVRK